MNRTLIGACLAALAVAATAASIAAQAPTAFEKRTYFWYAQMVSFDAPSKTLTAKAPFEPAVAKYIDQFKPADKIMILWAANAGKPETGPAMYVAKLEDMRTSKVDSGYIVPAEFVSADAGGKILTFKVTVPESAVSPLKGISAGQWMKVAAPMSQPDDHAQIASIESTNQPPAFKHDTAPPPPPNPYQKKVPGDK